MHNQKGIGPFGILAAVCQDLRRRNHCGLTQDRPEEHFGRRGRVHGGPPAGSGTPSRPSALPGCCQQALLALLFSDRDPARPLYSGKIR